MAIALYEKMRADPPRLSNGERLDALLMRVSDLSQEQTSIILDEYLRFLAIAAKGLDMAVPSPLIDAVWHKHIEDTRAYSDYCMRVIGKFVHHTPNLAHQSHHPAYPRTLESYSTLFGSTPAPHIWPSAELLKKRQASINISGAAIILVFFSIFLMVFGDHAGAKVVGFLFFLVAATTIIYAAFTSGVRPWRLGKRLDGGCSGGDGGGCGGCGGD